MSRAGVKVNIIRLTFFFFNDTATTEIYTLSLHDALPISPSRAVHGRRYPEHHVRCPRCAARFLFALHTDRKSTRLNSSHGYISYAVFCLKKKNTDALRVSINSVLPACCALVTRPTTSACT